MNQSESLHTVGLMSRFVRDHSDLLSPTATGHMEAAITIMSTIGMVLPLGPATTLGRVGGMCPCEVADCLKGST